MQKYNQYCPIARATEILGDRWTLLIVRELLLGSRRFNEIERGLPGMSRSLLASRLRGLEESGVVERLPGRQSKPEYHLSHAGRDVKKVIEALGSWGVSWAFGEPRPEELDAGLLIWRIHQRIHRELLPSRRTVVEFDFTGPRARRVWLLLEPSEVSVCVTPPGFDSDLVVRTDLMFFYRVWLGHIGYDAATRCGAVTVEGHAALVKQLPRWLMWSPMASFVREHERNVARNDQGPPRSDPGASADDEGRGSQPAARAHCERLDENDELMDVGRTPTERKMKIKRKPLSLGRVMTFDHYEERPQALGRENAGQGAASVRDTFMRKP